MSNADNQTTENIDLADESLMTSASRWIIYVPRFSGGSPLNRVCNILFAKICEDGESLLAAMDEIREAGHVGFQIVRLDKSPNELALKLALGMSQFMRIKSSTPETLKS